MTKVRTSGSFKSGKKRKNMPGYRLGMAKDGDKAWMVANRPQDIQKTVSRDEFFNSEINPGSIIGLDDKINGIFLGFHKGNAIVLNPKNQIISNTGLSNLQKINIMRAYVSDEYLDDSLGRDSKRNVKIPGTDLFASDIFSRPHNSHTPMSAGNHSLQDYFYNSKRGDLILLSNSEKRGSQKVLMSTSRYLVLEDVETGGVWAYDAIKKMKSSGNDKNSKNTIELQKNPSEKEDSSYELEKIKNDFNSKKYNSIKLNDSTVVVTRGENTEQENKNVSDLDKIRPGLNDFFKKALEKKPDLMMVAERQFEGFLSVYGLQQRKNIINNVLKNIKMALKENRAIASGLHLDKASLDQGKTMDENEDAKALHVAYYKKANEYMSRLNKKERTPPEALFTSYLNRVENPISVSKPVQNKERGVKDKTNKKNVLNTALTKNSLKKTKIRQDGEEKQISTSALSPDGRFNGYVRLDKGKTPLLESLNNGQEIFGYNKINKKIEVLKVDSGNQSFKVLRDWKGNVVEEKGYVFLNKKEDNDDVSNRIDNLIDGDIVAIKTGTNSSGESTYEQAYVVWGRNINGENNALLHTKNGTIKAEDAEFKIPNNSNETHSIENILLNIPDSQTHIVLHGKNEINPYRIEKSELFFNDKTGKLERFMVVNDKDNNKKYVNIVDDRIDSDLLDKDSKIATICYDKWLQKSGRMNYSEDNFLEEQDYAQEEYGDYSPEFKRISSSPLKQIHHDGLLNFFSRMSIPGLHNLQSFTDSEPMDGNFSYSNALSINGTYAGAIDRETEYEDGRFFYYNSFFALPPTLQGTGIAENFYNNQEKFLRECGINVIKMQCAMDVGGYAWAKKGFDFDPFDNSPDVVNEFRERILLKFDEITDRDWQEIHPGISWREIKNHRDNIENDLWCLETAGDIASYNYSYTDDDGNDREIKTKRDKYRDNIDNNKYHLGKATMLGSDWYGIKYLA